MTKNFVITIKKDERDKNMRISNSVTLTAIVNGATYLTSFEREENTPPLFQFWDKNNNAVTPDWTSGSHPIVYAKCTDTTGKEYQINNAVLVYNNAEITFDVNGYSTNSVSIEGKPNFKKDTKVVGGITYTIFHIIENLFGDNNSDSDTIMIKGQIQTKGGNIQYIKTSDETIAILQTASGGYMYYPFLECGTIEKGSDYTVCRLSLYESSTGSQVNDSGITYKFQYSDGNNWRDISSGDNGFVVNGNTLTVYKSRVDTSLMIRGVCVYSGNEYADAGIVFDKNDPLQVWYNLSGTTSMNQIYEGETATIVPLLMDSNKGDEPQDVTSNYTFTKAWLMLDGRGLPIDNISEYVNDSGNITISYDQVFAIYDKSVNISATLSNITLKTN